MISERTICKIDPTFDVSGKMLPSVHVEVVSIVSRNGDEIGRQNHRYVVSLDTMNMNHIPVDADERGRLGEIMATMVSQYGVADPVPVGLKIG